MSRYEYKKFLVDAIKNFITIDEVLDDKTLKDAAENFVYENDEEIRNYLRDEINLDEIFEDVLADINWNDIW